MKLLLIVRIQHFIQWLSHLLCDNVSQLKSNSLLNIFMSSVPMMITYFVVVYQYEESTNDVSLTSSVPLALVPDPDDGKVLLADGATVTGLLDFPHPFQPGDGPTGHR